MTADLPGWARDALRCPACGEPLRDGTEELICTGGACALAYPVRDGIPVLLVDESYPSRPPRRTV